MRSREILSLAAALVVALLVCIRVSFPNPLWKSEADLKVAILNGAPLGSSINQVKALVAKQNWKLLAEWHGNPSTISSEQAGFNDYPGVSGEYFIQANLGRYQGIPWPVGVDAHWGFDSAGKLVDLRIRKVREGL